MEESNSSSTKCFRILSWMMNVYGHKLLFTPLIRLFSMIPFVGWLLASIISAAAWIFSFLWGTMIHVFVMGIAWVFYRPLFGIALLSLFAAIFFLMNYKGGVEYDVETINNEIAANGGV
jgi:hypothetical protein